ncbi:hypothetical protein K1T35_48170 (plasmid) [Pseudonocardia sp. DSM 110487]|uniref:hypothetical protein n=1 Tax=Pseudonocardia sp. DSM 110487 TaxID=2865833 RepID=UPI001C6A8B29|nr:hypothetical protein [Pseudonocardia sp. DSM 110487]QYN41126.1 hypothetical protein K1T35_48170 [Pseudonocardia sp. DSM 110487]
MAGEYRKRMDQIVEGEIVLGHTGGWWRITNITDNEGVLSMVCRNVDTNQVGLISGTNREVRRLRTR